MATVQGESDRAELLAEATAKSLQEQRMPILCDITPPGDVERLAPVIARQGPCLDAVLNHAGTAYVGPLELLPLEDVRV